VGSQSHRRDAKFRRETGETESAKDAERETNRKSQTPTAKAKGHKVHSQSENRNAELIRVGQDSNAQTEDTAIYARQSNDSGDGQAVDNHVNSTVSSRRRQTRQTDSDTSNARDANRAELLTDTTCQVVTYNACELAADEKQITDAQVPFSLRWRLIG